MQPDAELAGQKAELGDAEVVRLGLDRRQQARAVELHDVGHLGRLHVAGAAGCCLADERGRGRYVLSDVAPRAHLHKADAERLFCVRHVGSHLSRAAPRAAPAQAASSRSSLPCALERVEVVAAADVLIADPDLRHRVAAAGLGAHLGAQLALADVDLLECRNALLAQELLCHVAVGAKAGRVDSDLGHGFLLGPFPVRPLVVAPQSPT